MAEDTPSTEFLWGAGASSVSAEGVAPPADWSVWERDGRAPRSGDGAGFALDFRDDLAQLARLGLNSLRLTVEWARVEPAAGRVDNDALDRYLDITDAALAEGLGVWITLHHTSLPGWYLDDEGGHADETARRRWWARHTDRMAEAFDGRAAGWCPIEDPIGWAVRGYGLGTRPPGRRSAEATAEAAEGAMLALHEACRLLESGPQPVMAVFGAPTLHAAPIEREHADAAASETRRWDELLWGTWTRALREGAVEVPGRAPVAAPYFEQGPELVGLIHDHPVGVTEEGSAGELAGVDPALGRGLRTGAGRAGRGGAPGHRGGAGAGRGGGRPRSAHRRRRLAGHAAGCVAGGGGRCPELRPAGLLPRQRRGRL